MSMPIFNLLKVACLAAFLIACGKKNDDATPVSVAGEKSVGRIECALAGSTVFSKTCLTERMEGEKGEILSIRHPDGGFRQFNILTDGRGLSPAQGFDPTGIEILDDGRIELISGDDRYRLPALIKAEPATIDDDGGEDTG